MAARWSDRGDRGGGGGGGGDRGRVYERERVEDTYYREGSGTGSTVSRRPESPPRRERDHSADRYPPPRRRAYDDDYVRDPRYHGEDRHSTPQPPPPRRDDYDDFDDRRGPPSAAPAPAPPPPPPPPPTMERERPRGREVVMERERELEREYDYGHEPVPPPRRPTALRRQSSLDTFDRRPIHRLYEREEYGPPARREDYRPGPAPTPPPMPRTRQLAPPERRTYNELPPPERRTYNDLQPWVPDDEIKIAEPDRFGDEEFHSYPERVREREYVRERRRRTSRSRSRSRSRDSYTTTATGTTAATRKSGRSRRSRRGRSKSVSRSSRASSSSSSRSSSTSSASTAVRSEYPKRGKTKIPARLVAIRALIDLGYPFVEQGNTIIVQKALGQENIDELLKLSDEYKRSEMELVAHHRSSAPDLVEDRVHREFYAVPAPAPPAALPPPPELLSPIPTERHSYAPPPSSFHHHAMPAPPSAVSGPPPPPPPVTGGPLIVDVAPPPPASAPPSVTNETTVVRTREEYVHEYPSSHHHYHDSPSMSHHHHDSPAFSHHHHHTASFPSPDMSSSVSSASYSAYSPSISSPHRAHFTSPTSGPMVVRDQVHFQHQHRRHESSDDIPLGAMVLAPRHRSHSRSGRNIRREIRGLERELRDRRHGSSSELVKAERLPDGGVVLYEEKVEKVQEGLKGARIERDKKGRMAISIPKYR